MIKSNREIAKDINACCIGALKYAYKQPEFIIGTNEFYDAFRKALSLEENRLYRRAMSAWDVVFSLNESAFSQGYALHAKARCNRALKAIAASKRIEDETAVPGESMKCSITLGAEW